MPNVEYHRGMSSSGCVREFAKFCANAEKMNKKMAQILPELASSFAEYPLVQDDTGRTHWVDVEGKTAKGGPVFVPDEISDTSSTVGSSSRMATAERRVDFVYGKGPAGWGYYHLLTRGVLQNTSPAITKHSANSMLHECQDSTRDGRSRRRDEDSVCSINSIHPR